MCGIITRVNHKPVNKNDNFDIINDMFLAQQSRGRDGIGAVIIGRELDVRRIRATNMKNFTEMYMESGIEDIVATVFHHRFPTSTDNFSFCAHPILVQHAELQYNYYAIHNGVISNCHRRKIEHNGLGYLYETEHIISDTVTFPNLPDGGYILDGEPRTKFNDSESIAIDSARMVEGLQTTIKSEGGYAVVLVRVDKATNKAVSIIYLRNTSPLIHDVGNGELCLRSEKSTATPRVGGQNYAPASNKQNNTSSSAAVPVTKALPPAGGKVEITTKVPAPPPATALPPVAAPKTWIKHENIQANKVYEYVFETGVITELMDFTPQYATPATNYTPRNAQHGRYEYDDEDDEELAYLAYWESLGDQNQKDPIFKKKVNSESDVEGGGSNKAIDPGRADLITELCELYEEADEIQDILSDPAPLSEDVKAQLRRRLNELMSGIAVMEDFMYERETIQG